MEQKFKNKVGRNYDQLCLGYATVKDGTIVKYRGLPFIANPDYVTRLQNNWPLSEADQETFYTWGTQGFTGYSNYKEVR